MFTFVVVFIWVFACLLTAACGFKGVSFHTSEDEKAEKKKGFFATLFEGCRDRLDADDYKIAVAIGVISGLAAVSYKTNALWACFCLIAMTGALAWLAYWCYWECEKLKQLIPVGLAGISMAFSAMTLAARLGKFVGKFWGSVIMALTIIALLVTATIIICFCLSYQEQQALKNNDEATAKRQRTGAIVMIAIMLLAAAGTSYGAVNWKALGLKDPKVPTTDEAYADAREEARSKFWDGVHFYNDDVQGGSTKNDRNFGPNPWNEGMSADYYVVDMQDRYHEDPVLLAAILLSYDCAFGTDYAGEVLYSGYDEKISKLDLANAVAETLCTDEELFNKAVSVVDARQGEAKIRLKKLDNLTDQMYMEPYTMIDRPELVIYETNAKTSWCLVCTYTLKNGKEVEIIYRIPCGYQPCNVAEKFGVTPSKPNKGTPSKPSKPGKPGKGDNGKPKKPGKGDNGKPSYNKDSGKAPKKNTEPNDDPGPGPKTIDPKDPEHSTEDTKDSSTSGSYEDYKKDQQDKADTNKNQKSGGDSSKPSTDGGGAKQDNNGSKADTPTQEHGGTAADQKNDGQVSEPS